MKCPVCGILNPAASLTCDCGFNFARQAKHDRADTPSFYARHKLPVLGLVFVIGAAIVAFVWFNIVEFSKPMRMW